MVTAFVQNLLNRHQAVVCLYDGQIEKKDVTLMLEENHVSADILWSLLEISKKKQFGPKLIIQSYRVFQTPEQMGKRKISSGEPELPSGAVPDTIRNLIGRRYSKLYYVVVQNSGIAQTAKGREIVRLVLGDGTGLVNAVCFELDIRKHRADKLVVGKVIEIHDALLTNNAQYKFAATIDLQIKLLGGVKVLECSSWLPTYPTLTILSNALGKPDNEVYNVIVLLEDFDEKAIEVEPEQYERSVFVRDRSVDAPLELKILGNLTRIFGQPARGTTMFFGNITNQDGKAVLTTGKSFFLPGTGKESEELLSWSYSEGYLDFYSDEYQSMLKRRDSALGTTTGSSTTAKIYEDLKETEEPCCSSTPSVVEPVNEYAMVKLRESNSSKVDKQNGDLGEKKSGIKRKQADVAK